MAEAQEGQGGQGGAGGSVGLTAQSLYCPVCRQAQPVRTKLLLVLPVGEKFGFYCAVCAAELGAKLEKAQV